MEVPLVNKEQIEKFMANEHMKLVEAMQKIDDNSRGILFVVNQKLHLCGALTDGDIRRWLLNTGVLDVEIVSVMNHNPKFLYRGNGIGNEKAFMTDNAINAIPLVDEQMQIVDIALQDNVTERNTIKSKVLAEASVIVMAGGKGTRLYPYTKILPKPLIPIGDIPIVERIINSFHDFGIVDFLMTVNYRKNMIRSYFSEIEKEYNVDFIEEDEPLGTAGSIKLINKKFDKPLFITNCDILIRTDYYDLYRFHQKSGNAITIVTAMKNDTIPYGVIYSKENGQIDKIIEKPKRSYFVNTGMYIINPEIINLIPDNTFFHMTHLTDKAIEMGYKVGMYPVSEDSFLDMGEFEEMKRMEEKLCIH